MAQIIVFNTSIEFRENVAKMSHISNFAQLKRIIFVVKKITLFSRVDFVTTRAYAFCP